MNEEILLTPQDIAELLQVSIKHVHHLARKGAIPHIRISPRKIRFIQSAIKKWIDEQTMSEDDARAEFKRKKEALKEKKWKEQFSL